MNILLKKVKITKMQHTKITLTTTLIENYLKNDSIVTLLFPNCYLFHNLPKIKNIYNNKLSTAFKARQKRDVIFF